MWSSHSSNSQREKRNRELLSFGYIRRHSTKKCCIPLDVVKLMYKFYDNGVCWLIKNDQMTQCLSCKFKDVIFGPKFEPIPGMLCQLTVSPNGWNVQDRGFVICYFEVHKFPNYLKNITLSFILYCKQFEYEYKKTVCYAPNGCNKCHGWSQGIRLSEVKQKEFKCMNIECITDVIHIEYKKSAKRDNVVSIIPYIGNSPQIFSWSISKEEPELFIKLKNTRNYKLFYSDSFYNNCWVLRCAPFGYNKNTAGNVWLFIQLIRAPFRIKSMYIRWSICVISDADIDDVILCGTNWFSLDMDGADGWGKRMFHCSLLKTMTDLQFVVKIQVLNIHTYQ